MVSSGDHLAPVVYLFGAGPDAQAESPEHTTDPRPGEPAQPAADAPVEPSERDVRRAQNVSINGLTRRNMSRWEVEKLLISREIDPETISSEIARLEAVGLIDDAFLAETLVRTRRERKGLGHQALVAELRRRHIDQEIIDAALDTGDDDGDEEQQRANELAVKRAGQLSSYDAETAKRRLTAFLMRKGYSSSIVRAATTAALDGRSGGVRFR